MCRSSSSSKGCRRGQRRSSARTRSVFAEKLFFRGHTHHDQLRGHAHVHVHVRVSVSLAYNKGLGGNAPRLRFLSPLFY